MENIRRTDTDAHLTTRGESFSWGGPFVMGLLVTLLGVVALSASVVTSLISVFFYGGLLLASGVFELVSAFKRRKTGGALPLALAGILSVVVGFLVLARPLAGLVALTLLIAGFFFVNGLFHAITALMDRYRNWGWDFAYGAIAVVLGVIVIGQLPAASLWLLGTMISLEIIFRGVALMSTSLAVRRVMKHPITA